jgi:hypothetical protein
VSKRGGVVVAKGIPRWLDLGEGFYISLALNAFLLVARVAPGVFAALPVALLPLLGPIVWIAVLGGIVWSGADFAMGWRYRQRSLMVGGVLGVLFCAWLPLLQNLHALGVVGR